MDTRKQAAEDWRKLHNEERHDLYWSAIVVWVTKSRGNRCVGHVARMRDRRGVCRILVVRLEGNDETTWGT